MKEFHPSEEILDLAIQSGIKVLQWALMPTLDELGEGIDEALAMLERKNASTIFIPGEGQFRVYIQKATYISFLAIFKRHSVCRCVMNANRIG